MKIGLDIDGVIEAHSEDHRPFWAALTAALLAAGHEVHIITYRSEPFRGATASDLARGGIAYTALHMAPAGGGVGAPRFKAGVVAHLGIEAMVEDEPEVLEAMPPGVLRLWVCDPAWVSLRHCIEGLRRGMGG